MKQLLSLIKERKFPSYILEVVHFGKVSFLPVSILLGAFCLSDYGKLPEGKLNVSVHLTTAPRVVFTTAPEPRGTRSIFPLRFHASHPPSSTLFQPHRVCFRGKLLQNSRGRWSLSFALLRVSLSVLSFPIPFRSKTEQAQVRRCRGIFLSRPYSSFHFCFAFFLLSFFLI